MQGFGGKFGVESDNMDASAKGWDDKGEVPLHGSQTDHKKGFGGKFGVDDHKDAVSRPLDIHVLQQLFVGV